MENIFPVFDKMLRRSEREVLLGQKAGVFWLYGLSGSGKSTLACRLERRLHEDRCLTRVLDGDNVRKGLNRDLGFSDDERRENIRRIAEISKLFLDTGIITINAFITPKRELRRLAREIIGPDDFFEIWVKCSYEKCLERDVKGLYAKAEAGTVKEFTGKDSAFEPPERADLVIDSEKQDVESSLETLYRFVAERVRSGDAA